MFRFLILLVVLGVIGVGVAEWANEAWTEAGPAPRETGRPDRAARPHA